MKIINEDKKRWREDRRLMVLAGFLGGLMVITVFVALVVVWAMSKGFKLF